MLQGGTIGVLVIQSRESRGFDQQVDPRDSHGSGHAAEDGDAVSRRQLAHERQRGLSLRRQVQLTAGSLVVAGSVVGLLLNPLFIGIATAVFGVAAGALAAWFVLTNVMNIGFSFLAGPALGVAGLALLVPIGTFAGAWWTDLAGVVITAAVLGPDFLAKRRERAASAS